tara:strand:- start:343 stop:792 length:450 start_codon:yes stop_codon:yes gene_type:complete
MEKDEKWMEIAIIEANIAKINNEVPIGAVIVKNEKLLSRGHNQCILNNDPTAHAEIQAIRNAGKKQKNYRLTETTLYVTLEPCSMCIGAIMNARIDRVVFGAYDNKLGKTDSFGNCKKNNSKLFFLGGVLEDNCKSLLLEFFKSRRKTK